MDYCSMICIVLAVIVQTCQSQSAEQLLTPNPCITKSTCFECIQTPKCSWCYQPDFDDKRRCFHSLTSPAGSCNEEFVYSPANLYSVIENRAISKGGGQMLEGGETQQQFGVSSSSCCDSEFGSVDASGHSFSVVSEESVVQLSPQRVSLTLRVNEAHSLKVTYAQAKDYPIDLYYLMDLSNSMKNDKEKLSTLGESLSEAMKRMTRNFRLGFGSFVDKVVMPYVSTVPKNLREPCTGCAAPYGFIHKMPLSQNTQQFTEAVNAAQVSGNLDAPEGGFDAMMQAIVCRREIGWREKARRLLVFSTDAGFHYAGDGKLGGIVQPNDGLCHLDASGKYTHSEIQDYPSISQINLKIKQNAINVIFAVTAEQIDVYNRLAQHIEGATTGILTNDSSNVVELVRTQYQKITSSVELKDNSTSDVQITYHSSCLSGGELKQTSRCDGLKANDTVVFSAEITLKRCPTNPAEWNQIFHIYPVGINESLLVDLKMICDCPCARLDGNALSVNEQAVKCSNAGRYECGVCICFPGRYGQHCECGTAGETPAKPGACKASPNEPDCSGRGSCFCGQCECNKRTDINEQITGTYCECDNFSCDRNNGSLCSGPTHGICECGHCKCLPGWTGDACDCSVSVETCIAPGTTDICSGHGRCECGMCVCDIADEKTRYSGRFCDQCPTCPGRCDEFRYCVECQMYGTGLFADNCTATCTTFVPVGVPELTLSEANGEHACTFYDANDCVYAFIYSYDENNRVQIRAKQEKSCPPVLHVPAIILGVIGAIVLIGLALLMMWKMITTIHDRREFARFEKERMKAKWETGENPIYRQATSTFKNPTYSGK